MIPYSKQYSLQTTEERNLLQESFCLIIVSLLPKHMREIEINSGPLLLFGLFLIQSITELQLSTIRFVSKLSQKFRYQRKVIKIMSILAVVSIFY